MNIFIHYLDKELLDIYASTNLEDKLVEDMVTLSIKVAILLLQEDEHIYIPVSNYFESAFTRRVLERFRDIMDLEFINLVSSSSTLESFVTKKKKVYGTLYSKEQTQKIEEEILGKRVPGKWQPRSGSATDDIKLQWNRNIDSNLWEKFFGVSNYKTVSSFQRAIAEIPQKLGDKAFVVEHVLPKLRVNSKREIDAKEMLNKVITSYYIESFLNEFNAMCFRNFFLVSQVDDILPIKYQHIDYANIIHKLRTSNYNGKTLYTYLKECNNEELMLLKEKNIIYEILTGNKGEIQMSKGNNKNEIKTFIVHGHDDTAKLSLKNYLQNTLKLGEPIILSEKASGGKTIIEKFERYAEECNLVFVLLTPDDVYTENSKSRARQNVIFEMGYFFGKLNRQSGQVILLYKGDLELPNDISGIVYISIDNGIEAAGEEIRRELKELGYIE